MMDTSISKVNLALSMRASAKKQGQHTRVGAQSDNYFSPASLEFRTQLLLNLRPKPAARAPKLTRKGITLRALVVVYTSWEGVNIVKNMTPYTLEIFVYAISWTHTRENQTYNLQV